MNELSEQSISCPYCGETITVLIDGSLHAQEYVEDCQVCCRPIIVNVNVDVDGDANVCVRAENE